MRYYYLIAGLHDIQLNSQPALTTDALLELMHEQLSAKDWKLVELLRRDASQIELPEEREPSPLSDDDQRIQLHYLAGLKCKNKFVRDWFEFNLNLNNILAATICRKHGFDVRKNIVGDNEVAQILRQNIQTKDMGLAGTIDNFQEIMQLIDIDNLCDREKRQDVLRWYWLEEHTLFNNFEIENVLCYYLQSEILHRWDNLTIDEGTRIFKEIIADMKKDVKF